MLIAASTAAASVLSLSLPLPVHARRPRARITAIAAAFMATAAWRATMARCEVSKSGQYLHGSKINVPGCARRVRSEEECMCVCVCSKHAALCGALTIPPLSPELPRTWNKGLGAEGGERARTHAHASDTHRERSRKRNQTETATLPAKPETWSDAQQNGQRVDHKCAISLMSRQDFDQSYAWESLVLATAVVRDNKQDGNDDASKALLLHMQPCLRQDQKAEATRGAAAQAPRRAGHAARDADQEAPGGHHARGLERLDGSHASHAVGGRQLWRAALSARAAAIASAASPGADHPGAPANTALVVAVVVVLAPRQGSGRASSVAPENDGGMGCPERGSAARDRDQQAAGVKLEVRVRHADHRTWFVSMVTWCQK